MNAKEISMQTNKALAYFQRKGLQTICDWVTVDGFRVFAINVADAPEKVRRHVSKTYPSALVNYSDANSVQAESLHRERKWSEHLSN